MERISSPADLAGAPETKDGLVATAGVSAKARQYLKPEEIARILSGVIDGIPADQRGEWRKEVFYRYLLTKGASLDGEMRNYTGAGGARRFVSVLLNVLQRRHDPSVYLKDAAGPLKLPEAREPALSGKVQKITWNGRTLLFDRKVGVVRKNVDAVLLDSTHRLSDADLLKRPDLYLACGELKGGIDPAGADEHWKTARSAMERIRTAFREKGLSPGLFFVAAAIEAAMAAEIFSMLNNGVLTRAANLTIPAQVADLAAWLVRL